MDEFTGRDIGDGAQDGPAPERWVFPASQDPLYDPDDRAPRDLFACPFCEDRIQLTTRPGADALVAECARCETWFSNDEWRYYKQLVT